MMAKFIARRDVDLSEVYIRGGDSYGFPKAVFDVLSDRNGPFFGDWSKSERTFRFEHARGTEAVNWLREHGHRVAILEGGDIPRGPHECANCGLPYRALHVPEGDERCQECDQALVLVRAHTCDESCKKTKSARRVP